MMMVVKELGMSDNGGEGGVSDDVGGGLSDDSGKEEKREEKE